MSCKSERQVRARIKSIGKKRLKRIKCKNKKQNSREEGDEEGYIKADSPRALPLLTK
jgi:triosephosphate isomerase